MKKNLSVVFLILSLKNTYSQKSRLNTKVLIIGGGTSETTAGI